MGFVSDVVGGLFGSGADAAEDAANAQAAATDKAIAAQKEADLLAREDLKPFRDVGMTKLEDLGRLVTDPEAQRLFIENNPFFKSLAKRSTDTLFNNKAARGKLASGSTAEELQNSLLLLGSDLVNQSISQRQNLATLGANAAARQATGTLNTATNISDLLTQKGNAQASGIMGARNAQVGAVNTALSAAGLFI